MLRRLGGIIAQSGERGSMNDVFLSSLLARLICTFSLVVFFTSQLALGRADSGSEFTGGWFRLKTQFQGEGKCLEGNGAGKPAFMDKCQNATGQFWKLVPQANGYYRLKTQFQGEGKCLEGNGAGKPAFMDNCQNATGQFWKLVPHANDYYRLKTQFQGEGKCLEGNGAGKPVFMDNCQNATGQFWKLVPR